jgi:hypothetical protein
MFMKNILEKNENYQILPDSYQNGLFEQDIGNHNNWLRKGFLHCLIILFYKNWD